MQREVQLIPSAPRQVRPRPLLAHRWPLLVTGAVLTVLGTLIAWAMFLQSGGKFSFGPRLRAGPTRSVAATVTRVQPEIHFDGRHWNQVFYEFTWHVDGHDVTLFGMSFAPAGSCEQGDVVDVEVLEDDSQVSCVVGGVPHIYRQWLYARFWLVICVVPGSLILLIWLTGVFQLRRVLIHGDVSVGRLREVRAVPWILPEMLSVSYEFRDHRAQLRRNRHWVRARGALGERLRQHRDGTSDDTLPVLHDRQLPQWNRMLLPQDFLRAAEPTPNRGS